MKYKHYAPDADVTVVEGSRESTEKKIAELVKNAKAEGKSVGVLAVENIIEADLFISSGADNRQFASRLFDALREFDEKGIENVFVQFSQEDSFSLAVKNRLYKAAGNNIIYTEK